MYPEFIGKTILVTGGSSGIGAAIVEEFLKLKANVCVLDKKAPKQKDIPFLKCDITRFPEIKKAFSKIKKLDILVNCAGIYGEPDFLDMEEKEFDGIVDTNLKGSFFVSQNAIKKFKSDLVILNISSGLSVKPEISSLVYCASKAALNMLTKSLALKYADKNIRVNAVLPGPVDTPLLRGAMTKKEISAYLKFNPLSRMAKPKEIADLVLYLCSSKAQYITGALYSIDGGEAI